MSTRTWTIRDVLEWAAQDFAARGIESPRLDAELLVAKALETDRVGLYLDLNRPLVDQERNAIRPLVARRRDREPVAYILGHRDFWGRRFEVTPDVLIPRPDTETLVEHALECIPEDAGCRVLDVGTGGGIPGIPLAILNPEVQFALVDSVGKKIGACRAIAEGLGLDNVHPRQVRVETMTDRFDYVLARAVAALPRFFEWTGRLVRPGRAGSVDNGWLYFKGTAYREELDLIDLEPTHVWPLSEVTPDPFFNEKFLLHFTQNAP